MFSPASAVTAFLPGLPPDQLVEWLFLDLNSYFASVEQQDNPALRGRPIAVVPVMSDSTCAIAASDEAKAFGIKTGTNIGEARRLCPGLVLVEARHDAYVRCHHAILAEIDRHIPVHSVASIDEMACRLTGKMREPRRARALAMQIKAALAERIGPAITCSIGLAPNRFLAKVATDMEKPDGLVTITPADLPEALRGLKLRDLPGIGARMEQRLLQARIFTVWDLYHAEQKRVRAAWGGVCGERFWLMLHGHELPEQETRRHSLGHSHVLAPEQRPPDRAVLAARRLLLKAASRLRRMERTATAMDLALRLESGLRLEHRSHFPAAGDSFLLNEILTHLWASAVSSLENERVKKVSITLYGLRPDGRGAQAEEQPDLFTQLPGEMRRIDRERRDRLSRVMDDLNQRYGRDTVSLGLAPASARNFSGSKIAFNRIPDEEEFRE